MAARLDAIEAFVDQQLELLWSWGTVDCSMMVADWVNRIAGKDPGASFRGQYHDEDTLRALIARRGGFMPMIGQVMDDLGFERTQSPHLGDVGLINVPFRYGGRLPAVQTISAIRHRNLWMVRGRDGIHFAEHPLITAWII